MADSVIWGGLQGALHSRLDADVDVEPAVYWGYDPDQLADEAVFVGYEEDTDRDFEILRGGSGHQPQDESFRSQIVIEVRRAAGTSLQTAYDRATVIAKAVETSIRDDLTLGGVVRHCHIGQVRRRYFRDADNRGARVFIDVVGDARF